MYKKSKEILTFGNIEIKKISLAVIRLLVFGKCGY